MTETVSRAGSAASNRSSLGAARRLTLIGGWGGIGAFVAWLLQPVIVFLIVGDKVSAPTWQYFHDYRWNGLYEVITFGGIAIGLLLQTISVGRLVEAAGGGGVAWSLARSLGTLAATAWIFAAGITLTPYTSVGNSVPQVIPGVAEQNAVYEAVVGFGVTSALLVFALASIGWLILLSFVARRAGLIGWPLAITALVAAGAAALPITIPFTPPFGMIAALAFAFVFGIALLVKSRRA